MFIRRALPSDWPDIWQIIGPVIRAGDTYALDRDMSEGDVRVYWMGDDRETFVAEWEGCIAGTYYIRRNQAGGGSHVCNCGYITSGQFAGRGVARALCEYSLALARERGYRAMQFNFVVAPMTEPSPYGHPSVSNRSADCQPPSTTPNWASLMLS